MQNEQQVIESFRRAMAEQGIVVSGHIEADGKFHRVHVDGDKRGAKNGWFVLHLDGTTPAGAFGCNKRFGTDAKFTWAGETRELSPEERRAWAKKMAKQKAEREAAELQRREMAAAEAERIWAAASECTEHPYLTRKGVKSHGLRVGLWEKADPDTGEVHVISKQALLVPIRDTKKRVHSLQAIFAGKAMGGRDKDFLSGGAKEGLFYSIGKPQEVEHRGEQRKVILIGEGYATMASAHEATGHACIVAFDAGNLVPVARAIRRSFPDALLVFVSDNDQWTGPTPEFPNTPENPGLTKAREAARLTDGLVAFPDFAHDAPGKPTDFNDLHAAQGLDAVRAAIEAVLHPPARPAPAPQPEPAAPVAPWEDDPDDAPDETLAAPLPEPVAGADDPIGPEANSYFTVLGYDRKTYYVLQHLKKQIAEISAGGMSETGLIELAPLNWWELEFPGGKAKFDTKMAAEFLIRTAEKKGIFDTERIRGRGAWLDAGRVVYHHGSHLSVDGARTAVTSIQSSYVYELAKSMQMPAEVMLSDDDGKCIVDVIKMFRWGVSGSALLFAGWIALAPICGAIPWRPHVWLTGGAGSGKSTLAKFGHAMLKGTDVFAQGNSSEAGIRQRLRADARPVVMDESESNEEGDAKRIQSILGLIRQASTESDAETLKGTTDGSGMTYHIRSMFCLASIQVALKHKADIDRLTVLSLRSGKSSDSGEWLQIKEAMYQLTDKDATIRARLLRRCIDMLPVTLKNIEVFSAAGADFFGSQRDGDQYGALLAGAWSLMSQKVATPEQARKVFASHNWHDLRDNHDTDESQSALQALLGSLVRIKGGIEVSVYELVCAASGRPVASLDVNDVTAEAILQRHGMRVKDGYLMLANGHKEITALMQGTTFEADWRGVLARVEGADKNGNNPARFNGVLTKCIRLPLSGILVESAVGEREPEPAF